METMISLKILGTYFIVKVFVELQKQNESTVTSFAWLKTIEKVIWILMQCTDDKITYPSDLLTNKFQPSDSLLCPQKSLLTVTFQRKKTKFEDMLDIICINSYITKNYHHLFIK